MLCIDFVNCDKMLVLPTTASTNEVAKQMLHNHADTHGQIVQAMHQTAGKGQSSASWHNEPEKDLLFSLILQHNGSTADGLYLLNMAIALAIYSEVNKYFNTTSIKWSNDIFVGDKKIAGILIENSWRGSTWQSSVVGIGLNVFSHSKSFDNYDSISLKEGQIDGIQIHLILKNIIIEINNYLSWAKSDPQLVIKLYNKKLYKINEMVNFWINNEKVLATINGVNAQGELLLSINGIQKAYNYGSVKQII
jgi:BirA family transcriptional regulator, biotin operon repressor / biotin---[acetyl-CoA-carboxylase] ligase